jgi:YVTN family beta-propeller protein
MVYLLYTAVPSDYAGVYYDGAVYVVNVLGNSVSVIDPKTNTNIKNIPVGAEPSAIGYEGFTNTIYVANRASNTLSVIDPNGNNVVAKVTFNTMPFKDI